MPTKPPPERTSLTREQAHRKWGVGPAASDAGRDFGLKQSVTLHARIDRAWLADLILKAALIPVALGWQPTATQTDRIARFAVSFIKASVYTRPA